MLEVISKQRIPQILIKRRWQSRWSKNRSHLVRASVEAKLRERSSRLLPQTLGEVRQAPALSPNIEGRFHQLATEWKEQAALVSSPVEMAMLPAYQRIIGMGRPVLPLILRELQREPHFWFWALRAITGADPVPAESYGRVPEMTAAWLQWGRQQGFLR